jgi:hypothetical protein
MKLVPFLVATVLSLGAGVVHADELLDPYPADIYGDPAPQPPPRADRERGPRAQRPMPELRRMLVERFDRNHDGRLEPRERRQAVRALRRLERKLARQDGRGARLRKLIRKYDLNGDGNVGPGEMPPEMARRMRKLDRNGDGWVDGNDFGR